VRYSDTPESVFKGSFSTWVKNYGPQSTPRPAPSVVTDERSANDRLSFGDLDVQEKLSAPPIGPLPNIIVTVPIDRVGCPMCGIDPRIVIPGDRRVNPVIVAPRLHEVPLGVVPEDIVAALNAPGVEPVVASRKDDGRVQAVVVDTASGRLLGSVVREESGDHLVSAASTGNVVNGARTRSFSGRSASSGVGGDDQNPAGSKRIMALNAKGEVLDFGPATGGAHGRSVRVVDASSGREQTRHLSGAPLATVVGAAYRPADDSFYVLDVTGDGVGSKLRLVRITGANASVVGAWARSGQWKWYGLSANVDGSITITSARENEHAFIVFDLDGVSRPTARFAAQGKGTLAHPVEMGASTLVVTYLPSGAALPAVTSVPVEALHRSEPINEGRLVPADASDLRSLL
jgi:hypothetical protein